MSKLKFIEQSDEKDCGPACLAMISSYFGKRVSVAKLRIYCGTDLIGTNIMGMIEGGKRIGLNVEAFEVNELSEIQSGGLPAIFHIVNDAGLAHYVIVYRIGKNYVYIMDPEKGKYKLKKQDFNHKWTKILMLVSINENFEKKHDKFKTIKSFYFNLLKNNVPILILIFMFSLLINTVSIFGSFYFQIVIDFIIPSDFIQNLHLLSIGLLFLYLATFLGSLIRYQLTLALGMKISKQMMLGYYNHVLHLPMSFFSTRKEGEILSRFRDIDNVRNAFSAVTVSIVIDSIMIICGSLVLYFQNSKLFFIVLLMIPIYLMLALFFKTPYERYNRQAMEADAELSSTIIEGIKGIKIIKSTNSENEFYKKTITKFETFFEKVFKIGMFTNLQLSIKSLMTMTTTLLIIWFGTYLIMENQLTLGTLLTFNAIVVFFFNSIERLIDVQSLIQSSIVSTRRVMEIQDLDKEEKVGLSKFKFNNSLVIQRASFKYGFRNEVIRDIDIEVKKGETIGIVGESGSGKSTLANLLLKYYDISSGKIELDGINYTELSNKSIRMNISYVQQNNFIFSGTIIENLQIGCSKNYSIDKVIRACKLAEIHEFIMGLSCGYDTILESEGNNLSGGQIQRLGIARAILKDSDVLILDEPTSALDSNTEKKIINNIKSLNKTTIIISHRLKLTQDCKTILVMKKGKIVERGSHEQLVRKKAHYYSLWESQNG
ncbi:peptidase domain-containing ABC transporter [Staphylococcus aureus]|uniref:peptidase domain-containing ABC transporter n=1 Tax=Staphylococcus aureus TaxID=1280 RepID=UPI00215C77B4|nr:peptidase domain-containing ABC transporter [Staphylococcus aureus]UVI92983.1 peptidase domain-containing ABC transporter [Staphylococcus aureus]